MEQANPEHRTSEHRTLQFIYTSPLVVTWVFVSRVVAMSSLSDTQRSNARLGLWLFAVYLLLYLGFVFMSAFAAQLMERPVIAGLNLAIVYGFGLIVGALVMALIYGMLCKSEPLPESSRDASPGDAPKGDHT